jgi:hypothetical protein
MMYDILLENCKAFEETMSGLMLEGQSQLHYERVVRMLEVVLGLLIASLQHATWRVPAVWIGHL